MPSEYEPRLVGCGAEWPEAGSASLAARSKARSRPPTESRRTRMRTSCPKSRSLFAALLRSKRVCPRATAALFRTTDERRRRRTRLPPPTASGGVSPTEPESSATLVISMLLRRDPRCELASDPALEGGGALTRGAAGAETEPTASSLVGDPGGRNSPRSISFAKVRSSARICETSSCASSKFVMSDASAGRWATEAAPPICLRYYTAGTHV